MQNLSKVDGVISIIRKEVKKNFFEQIFRKIIPEIKLTKDDEKEIYSNHLKMESLFNKIINMLIMYEYEMVNNNNLSDVEKIKSIAKNCIISVFGETNYKPIEKYVNRLNIREQIKIRNLYQSIIQDLLVQIEENLEQSSY